MEQTEFSPPKRQEILREESDKKMKEESMTNSESESGSNKKNKGVLRNYLKQDIIQKKAVDSEDEEDRVKLFIDRPDQYLTNF